MFPRMRYFVLLLALSGCAGGLQAFDAPGVPAPVFTPVGAGAPVLGQPGQHRSPPVLPPSPNKRILPLTREPGIWAADEIRAAKRDKLDGIVGVAFPIPSVMSPDGVDLVKLCEQTMSAALQKAKRTDKAKALPLGLRRCLVARLFQRCALTVSTHADKYDAGKAGPYRAAKEAADRFAETACTGQRQELLYDLFSEVYNQWLHLDQP